MTVDQDIIDDMKDLAKKEVCAVNPVVFRTEEKALYEKASCRHGGIIAAELLRKLWKIVENERKNRVRE